MNNFIGLSLPRGIRDNDPGNIRPNKDNPWLGQINVDDNYCVFSFIEYGIRAIAKDLHTKIAVRGFNTIAKYIPIYAPPTENNTPGYIARVESLSGIDANQILTADAPTLFKLVKAQINVEVSPHYAEMITDEMITTGVSLAFN